MLEKIIIDMLTPYSVSIITQKVIDVEGQELPVGSPHRKAYVNSENGRLELMQEISSPQLDSVLVVWGDTTSPIYKEQSL